MKKKQWYSRQLILYEIVGLVFIIFLLWLDEIFDIPNCFLGIEATPVNVVESLFETGVILCIGLCVIFMTWHLLGQIKLLEGFLTVCSFCKKIKTDGKWIPIEEFISKRSPTTFSHGLCPECMEEHYGWVFKEKAG
jgi:hypothetical protein